MLFEIEKEEFLRNKIYRGSFDFVLEFDFYDSFVNEYVLLGGLNCLVIFLIIFM